MTYSSTQSHADSFSIEGNFPPSNAIFAYGSCLCSARGGRFGYVEEEGGLVTGGFGFSCQICHWNGHDALHCYYQFDASFTSQNGTPYSYGRGLGFNSRSPYPNSPVQFAQPHLPAPNSSIQQP